MAERNWLFPRFALAGRIIRVRDQLEKRAAKTPITTTVRIMLMRAIEFALDLKICGIAICLTVPRLYFRDSGGMSGQMDIMSYRFRFPKPASSIFSRN